MQPTPAWGPPVPMGEAADPGRRAMSVTAPWASRGCTARKVHSVCVCVHARVLGNCFLEQREWTKWETATLKEPVDYPETSILFIFISDVNSILGDSLPAEPQGKPR